MGLGSEGGAAAGSDSSPRPALREVQLVVDPAGRGSIVVDGVDLGFAVNAVELQSQVGDATRMNLSVVAPRIEFDGQATIEVRDPTRAALIALGWTPPAEDAG
jgi:hypothetical protein